MGNAVACTTTQSASFLTRKAPLAMEGSPELDGIPPGTFRLMITHENARGVAIAYGETQVQVVQDVTAVAKVTMVAMPPQGKVEVTVDWAKP
jgi:hypothetical protein